MASQACVQAKLADWSLVCMKGHQTRRKRHKHFKQLAHHLCIGLYPGFLLLHVYTEGMRWDWVCLFVSGFWDRISLRSPHWSQTYLCPPSAGIKTYTTMLKVVFKAFFNFKIQWGAMVCDFNPSTQKAETYRFLWAQTSLVYIVRLCLKNKMTNSSSSSSNIK